MMFADMRESLLLMYLQSQHVIVQTRAVFYFLTVVMLQQYI